MHPWAIPQGGSLSRIAQSGYLMGIAIACAVSFNPLATSAAWSPTKANPQSSTGSNIEQQFLGKSLAQTNPANAPGEGETSNTDSNTDPESNSETGTNQPVSPIISTSWQRTIASLLSLFSGQSNAEITAVPVRLDGRTVFSVPPSINNRAEIIERRLQAVIQTVIQQGNFEPSTLKVETKPAHTENSSAAQTEIDPNVWIIYVSWPNQQHQQEMEIFRITTRDAAEIQGNDPETLAKELAQEIEAELQIAYTERQPESLKKQTVSASLVIFVMLLSNFSLISLRQNLQKEQEEIDKKIIDLPELKSGLIITSPKAEIAEKTSDENPDENPDKNFDKNPDENPDDNSEYSNTLKQQISLLQKRNFNEIQQGLAPLAQGGVFAVGTYIVLGIFPYSRWLQPLVISILPIPLRLIFTGISTYVAIRISRMAINRFFAALENRNFKSMSNSERLTLRFSTFSRVAKNLSSGLLITVGTLVALSVIGINIGPLLAGAGILGLGISLGAQNLVKDTINGFFILFEDQYAVGDVIVVGDVGGLVENMNLRITQLRNGEGRLITIPNSAITVVQNLSKEWARVDLTLDVSYQTNVDRAFAVIQEVVDEVYNEPEWREKIIAPPEVLGIDRMDHAGLMIRVWIKVKPLQHWIVGRECRRRLKTRLDREGISIGIPQQNVFFNNSLDLLPLKDDN